jgi:hypothetical protein
MSTVHRAQVVAVLFACLIQSPSWADDTPDDNATPESDAAAGQPADLNEQIEIVVNGGLRSDRVTEHGVSISLRNISDEEIAGPLGITINGTGIDELQLVLPEADGVTKNYFEVVRDTAVLRPGQTSRPIRVEFRSTNALTFLDRNNFALDAKVVRPEDVENEEDVATAADAEMVPGKDYSWEEMYEAFANQDKWTPFLMEHEGVVGTATSEDDAGNLVIRIYTLRHGVLQELPGNLGGMDLQQEVIGGHFVAGPAIGGVIRPGGESAISLETRQRRDHRLGGHIQLLPAIGTPSGQGTSTQDGDTGATSPPSMPAPGDGTLNPQLPALPGPAPTPTPPSSSPTSGPPGDPTIRFPRPVPIGVSTFNINDTCASGTIGCRCIDAAGNVYGLSNNHVWAAMNSGAGTDIAVIGDPIVQPGLGDHIPACDQDALDIIGFLADYEPYDLFSFNVMDAAIMSTSPAFLQSETPDDGYGSPSSSVFESPYIGLEVQKYGRTTIYTRGRIIGLNASALVGGTTQFENMVEMRNDPFDFGGPGDSGSLVVTIPDRRPVGVLFAGGGGTTLCNPIMPILERFNVIIDDGSLTPAPAIFPISGRMGIATGPVVPAPVTLP